MKLGGPFWQTQTHTQMHAHTHTHWTGGSCTGSSLIKANLQRQAERDGGVEKAQATSERVVNQQQQISGVKESETEKTPNRHVAFTRDL